MANRLSRREALQHLAIATAGVTCGGGIIRSQSKPIVVAGAPVAIVVASVSPSTVPLTVLPIEAAVIPDHHALVPTAAGAPAGRRHEPFQPIRAGDLRKGQWMKVEMRWRDAERRLTLRLAPGSRMLPPARRPMTVRLAGARDTKAFTFDGTPIEVRL